LSKRGCFWGRVKCCDGEVGCAGSTEEAPRGDERLGIYTRWTGAGSRTPSGLPASDTACGVYHCDVNYAVDNNVASSVWPWCLTRDPITSRLSHIPLMAISSGTRVRPNHIENNAGAVDSSRRYVCVYWGV
jgi:hypothetical protein